MMKYTLFALACYIAVAFAVDESDVNAAASSEFLTAEEHRLGPYGHARPYYYYPKYYGHYRGRRSTDAYPEPTADEVSTDEVSTVEAYGYDQSTEEYRRGYYGSYYPHRYYSRYHSYRPYYYGRPYWAY